MRLHWSPRSPFVRKVMIAATEIGVEPRIERMRNVVQQPRLNPLVMEDNPLNKIPVLVLDDGLPLIDSRVICEYLDSLHDGPKLFPASEARWGALRWQALGDGIMEQQTLLRNERLRDSSERSEAFVECYRSKVIASLDRLEAEATALGEADFAIGHIAVGCVLGYCDFRFQDLEWRKGRHALAAWYETFAARPSVQAHPVIEG